ncbi:MAG: glycosyltransferase [Chloroflexi bacterium]|nr:glycosyltransferase [Chloroflexota bacterium]
MKDRKSFATTLGYLMVEPAFAAQARLVQVPRFRPVVGYSRRDQLRIFGAVLRAMLQEEYVLLGSSRGRWKPELMAIAAAAWLPRRWRASVVLSGEMWEPNSGLRGRLEKWLVRWIDRAILRYAVYSSEELEVFPRLWGVVPEKVRFTPFTYTLKEQDCRPVSSGGYVFSGGNAFRDYDALVETARLLPERRFIIASGRLEGRDDLPDNLEAGPVPHERFMQLLCAAEMVVVPIRTGLRRAAGQQTYLNAMWLKKPTIVNRVLGVRDHIRHGETGLIVEGSPESFAAAIRWVGDAANRETVERMGENAHRDVSARFNTCQHALDLLEVVEEALHDDRDG